MNVPQMPRIWMCISLSRRAGVVKGLQGWGKQNGGAWPPEQRTLLYPSPCGFFAGAGVPARAYRHGRGGADIAAWMSPATGLAAPPLRRAVAAGGAQRSLV
ncbi:hypothetical protein PSP6_880008 [Paraburkholderia tropica]|nr:hypothetical protein PSP6_880008 [Paraburkholderia tropica]